MSDPLMGRHPTSLRWRDRALIAEAECERLRGEVRRLEADRRLAPTPFRCLNDECRTIAVGTGYKRCPGCGGELIDARAALGEADDE